MTNLRFANVDEMMKYFKQLHSSPGYAGQPCCICGVLTGNVGMFLPNQKSHAKFGGKPGKQRIIVYGLCDTCHAQDKAQDIVEEALLKDLAGAPQ
ncbi:MAG: hypothetical protein NVS9B4_00580 [Candidatus Acidiferrum sp.]